MRRIKFISMLLLLVLALSAGASRVMGYSAESEDSKFMATVGDDDLWSPEATSIPSATKSIRTRINEEG